MSGGASSAAIRRLPYTNRERLHNSKGRLALTSGEKTASLDDELESLLCRRNVESIAMPPSTAPYNWNYTCKYLDPSTTWGRPRCIMAKAPAEKAMARQGLGILEPPVPGPRRHHSGREVPRNSGYMAWVSLVPAIHLSRHTGIWGAKRPPTLLDGATVLNVV